MLNEDFVQTHNSNSQESSPEPVLMHNNAEFEGSETFNYPSSPKPTGVIVSTVNCNKKSYHATSINKRRQNNNNKRNRNVQSPPQNRLAFINAVKMAWSLQIKRGKRKFHLNKKISTNSDISIVKNKLDFPPITAEALSELSVSQLFKSLQIRHDLLIDPNLTFRPNLTMEKRQESETYWTRLDYLIKFCSTNTEENDDRYQLIFLVRNLLTELSLILISLISPFPAHPTTSFIWNWPQQITENYILSVLDPDLIHQQLIQGCLNVDFKFGFLYSVLHPLCPEQAIKVQKLVDDNEYARALEICFLTLETIKLDCANKALHYYRPYLIENGTSLEWKIFLAQLDNGEVNTSSVSQWMKCTYQRLGHETQFINIFRTGIINLVTDDNDTITALNLPSCTFPITFCYDEKRLKHQLRHEFQNIIVIALLLMPYRLMAGKQAKQEDLNQLKSMYSKLLKDASIASGRVSCFHLALHACNMANQTSLSKEDVIQQAKYWSNWMNQNLRNTSPVYKIMYDRVRTIILTFMAQGETENLSCNYTHATVGLEKEIAKLGKKLTAIADYNLRAFGSLYTYLLPSVRMSL
ncbi:T-complex protein 11-domain-containing protein [Helicostylum pulchrum]|uniref:Uncharacterized protein n=1 Tax=Helicostylum pulchrum TaxID=562976 RepID=A0ABP9XSW3_9FUNG|nr:T-complex protein 11-domain-containing protein [Helicostylum pulchrum]